MPDDFTCQGRVSCWENIQFLGLITQCLCGCTECIIISKTWSNIMSDQPKVWSDMIGHDL